ncbi:MAG TPA: ribosome biogenesis GTP-binding protein YihA/YsxC [Oligoflexia bacterium]|nr:ribosome biogenesis GTP-binding protein YihA/YsxC [Oligoflexia bacterium]
MYRVIEATFVCSAKTAAHIPQPAAPEVAFIGRSNSGKSSLLNALCAYRSLARTGRTPGRTQALNFFQIRLAHDGRQARYETMFVDLPGYGYAKVAKTESRAWSDLIQPYLQQRDNLKAAVLLMDCRRAPEKEELWFLEQNYRWKLFVALTKSDKISRNELKKRADSVRRELSLGQDALYCTSTLRGGKLGIDGLLQALGAQLFRASGKL